MGFSPAVLGFEKLFPISAKCFKLAHDGGMEINKEVLARDEKNGADSVREGEPSVVEEISMMAVDEIKPHPKNVEVYGDVEKDGSVAGLAQSISAAGIREPLVVTSEGVLVSGHRRLRAARSLNMTEVPVRVFQSTDETEVKVALLAFNVHRIKTKRQIIEEGLLCLEIKRAQKLARKVAKANGENMENFPTCEKGTTRDLAAQELGISGRTLEKGIKVEAAIAKLRADGREDDAAVVENSLEKSIDAGFTKAKSLGAIAETSRKKATAKVAPQQVETTPDELKAELVAVEEVPAVNEESSPKPVQSSDAAIEVADRFVSFLRSAEAKELNTTQRRELEKVLAQIVRIGEELGLIAIFERRAA